MRFTGSQYETMKLFRSRYQWIYLVLIIFSLIVILRLWHLQIIKGDEFARYSRRNFIKETKIQAPRGIIFDREGKVLVKNKVGFYLTIKPQFVKDLNQTLDSLKFILKNKSKVLRKIKFSEKRYGSFHDVVLKRNLSFDEVSFLKLLSFSDSSLSVKKIILRKYPLNENAAQLFGYVGEISKKEIKKYRKKYKSRFESGDIIGKNGFEKRWEKELRGENGAFYEEVDALGRARVTNFLGLKNKKATSGNHFVLTIDKDIQKVAYESMKRKDKVGERIGAVVAMKTNGEILAWVSLPSFNPNDFTEKIDSELWRTLTTDPFEPFRNKVIQDHFPPGSTIKPFIGLLALHQKIIRPEEKVFSPGFIRLGRRRWHDHKIGGHGEINLVEAIERSSNTFFYKLGIDLDVDKIARFSSLFQLGKKTGIDLGEESAGLVPDKKWKLKTTGEPWQKGESLSHAIGQGFWLMTPLQMLVLFNSLALEGDVYQPFLIKSIKDSDDNKIKEFKPKLVRQINEISKENFKTIKEGMFQVANGSRGTAKWWKLGGEAFFAGKTGTVQMKGLAPQEVYKKCESLDLDKRHHGWFGGYAPAEKPEISVVVLAKHSCHGSVGAVPVVRDIIKAYLKKYNPEILKKKKQPKIINKNTGEVNA